MSADRRAREAKVMRMIQTDVEADVNRREGQEFNGRNVSAALGEICAQVGAIARAVEFLLTEESDTTGGYLADAFKQTPETLWQIPEPKSTLPERVLLWPAPSPPFAEADDPMWSPLFEEVWHAVSYKPGFRLLLMPDQSVEGGRWYFQVEADRPDTYSGEMGVGRGGKAYLSPTMTRSELAQTAFGLFNNYEHHECREWFKYAGHRVYGPHFDVLALAAIADRTEHRGDPS